MFYLRIKRRGDFVIHMLLFSLTNHHHHHYMSASLLLFIGHLFLIIIDIFMPFWLVYMETCGIYFLTPSFVIYITKRHYHHHHHRSARHV
jgi:membrane-bound ClpP family serine protease